ncbi:MAG: glucose-1-phosphate thymidylyltransferase, partial [Terracoccus sp.]
VNDEYLRRGALTVSVLPRGTAWFDTGTFNGLMEASQYVHVVEARQGQKIGCVEEVAWRNGWLDDEGLARHAEDQRKSGYGLYLSGLIDERRGAR